MSMYLKTGIGWEVFDSPEEFSPENHGFKFDPNVGLITIIEKMLADFEKVLPPNTDILEFVAAIGIDAMGYWQVREELRVESKASLERFDSSPSLYEIPLVLSGQEGVVIMMKPPLAPALLDRQILKEEERRAENRAVKEAIGHFVKAVESGEVRIDIQEAKVEEPKKGTVH